MSPAVCVRCRVTGGHHPACPLDPGRRRRPGPPARVDELERKVLELDAECRRLRGMLATLIGASAVPVPCQEVANPGRVAPLALDPGEC